VAAPTPPTAPTAPPPPPSLPTAGKPKTSTIIIVAVIAALVGAAIATLILYKPGEREEKEKTAMSANAFMLAVTEGEISEEERIDIQDTVSYVSYIGKYIEFDSAPGTRFYVTRPELLEDLTEGETIRCTVYWVPENGNVVFYISLIVIVEEEEPPEGYTPTVHMTLKDMAVILNATDTSQNVSILCHDGADKVKWDDIKVLISRDGDWYAEIKVGDSSSPKLNVICIKEEPVEPDPYWSVGEALRFQESGSNWDPDDDFYVKIIYVPTKRVLQSLSRDIE
jgi:hypothetical protein